MKVKVKVEVEVGNIEQWKWWSQSDFGSDKLDYDYIYNLWYIGYFTGDI